MNLLCYLGGHMLILDWTLSELCFYIYNIFLAFGNSLELSRTKGPSKGTSSEREP